MAIGRKTVAPGQVVSSDWGNTVWDQSVQVFASSADRATQYPNPHEGATSWLEDVKRLDVYAAGAWVYVGPSANAFSWGVPIWGTPDNNRPVRTAGTNIVGVTSPAASMVLGCDSGRPWTALLAVTITPQFKYNDPGGFANSLGFLNTPGCHGTATGGQVDITWLGFDGNGRPSTITGGNVTVTFQD